MPIEQAGPFSRLLRGTLLQMTKALLMSTLFTVALPTCKTWKKENEGKRRRQVLLAVFLAGFFCIIKFGCSNTVPLTASDIQTFLWQEQRKLPSVPPREESEHF